MSAKAKLRPNNKGKNPISNFSCTTWLNHEHFHYAFVIRLQSVLDISSVHMGWRWESPKKRTSSVDVRYVVVLVELFCYLCLYYWFISSIYKTIILFHVKFNDFVYISYTHTSKCNVNISLSLAFLLCLIQFYPHSYPMILLNFYCTTFSKQLELTFYGCVVLIVVVLYAW